ncbi:MAG TPA: S8 family serine peptidase [Streptosporangiaceae bacterium]|nr:S8 family serine peptidase [Streptosporangiaceae bacterium]
MPLDFPRRVQAGVAAGVAVACLALSATPAFASGVRSREWWLQALHVTQAWQSTHAGGVTVALLDTGVDPNQPDLTGSVTTGPDYSDSGRVHGGPFWGIHGTAMASLIAGHGHGAGQAAGMMGVAPAATILSIRVTLESNDPLLADANIAAGLPTAIARGIRYAVRHGATVIDLPLDPVTAPGAPGAGGSPAERSAVAYALAHKVVLVAPAGDDATPGTDPVNFPAAYPGVISVGAFGSTFTKAAFSSQQPYVTLTAAGDGVVAASSPAGYTQLSSTAAASAMVAGIVALIRAQFPALSPAQVTKALTESTLYRRSGGQNNGSGAGTVDAARALAAAARMIEAVPASGQSAAPAGTPAPQPPSPPAAGTASKGSLRHTLLIDVAAAVAVFVVLVLAILGYSRLRRRRARAARLAEVRAAAQVTGRRPRQPAPVTTGASPEGYVPAPLSPGLPATTSSLPAGLAARRAAGSESAFPDSAFPESAFAGSPFAGTADHGAPGAGLDGLGGAPGTRSPAGPGGPAVGGPAGSGAGPAIAGGAAARFVGSHRLGVPRTPKITGTPPWEPAPEPDGEIPWAQAPPPPGGGRPFATGQPVQSAPPPQFPVPEPQEPEVSPWDAVAEEAWPGGPAADRPHPPAMPGGAASNGTRGHAHGPGNGTADEDSASRPIYVWDPGDPTGPVPPPDEDNWH